MATEHDAIAETDAFNDAFGAPSDPAPEPAKGNEDGGDGGGQARDDKGRFAGREEPVASAEPAKQPDPAERHHIPLAEHLSEREKRQEAERRAAEYERELAAYRRAQAEAAKPPRERPNLYDDPDGYASYVNEEAASAIQQIEQRMQIRFLDASFDAAKEQHGERFDKAYSAIMEEKARGNRALIDRIGNAANPGKALMRWYGEQETVRETGGDLNAYKQRVLDEAMKDPEYRRKVLAAAEAEARGGGNTIVDRSNITDLPSLTRTAGGGSRGSPGGDSDAELFASSFGRQRR